MDSNSFWRKQIFGIRRWELGLVFLLYFVFGFAYDITLYLTSDGQSDLFPTVVYEYLVKAFFTLPIWWLMFRKLAHWSIKKKVLLHLLFLPIFTVGQQQLYYFICSLTDEWHLDWPAAWWDIYIPGLFYVLQFGIFHVYDYYVKLQRQKELEAELRQLALKSELAALKSQLNPHFLYNTFNTISASLPPKEEHTRVMIAKFSDLFRYQLKASKVELVPLKDEIEFVKTYLELEKERFRERLEFQFDIDPNLMNKRVPPMILQPLVENSIRHGISPKIEGGNVEIRVFEKGENIGFEIKDSGVGLQGKKDIFEKGVGLANTKKRLEKMYNSQIQIIDNEEDGTKVIFEIPSIQMAF